MEGRFFNKNEAHQIAYFWNDKGESNNVCIHGKVWPETDLFTENGGNACRECCDEEFFRPRFLSHG